MSKEPAVVYIRPKQQIYGTLVKRGGNTENGSTRQIQTNKIFLVRFEGPMIAYALNRNISPYQLQ